MLTLRERAIVYYCNLPGLRGLVWAVLLTALICTQQSLNTVPAQRFAFLDPSKIFAWNTESYDIDWIGLDLRNMVKQLGTEQE
jgi:hypothetical protein